MARTTMCRVEECRRNGTRALPLGDGSVLDVPVCDRHADEIEWSPAAWRLTSIPIRNTDKERIVIVSMVAA